MEKSKQTLISRCKIKTAFPFLQLLISTKKQSVPILHLLLGIPDSSSSYCEGGFIFRHLRATEYKGTEVYKKLCFYKYCAHVTVVTFPSV